MGKGAALRWAENQLIGRHLRGRGIEIGALWKKFPVPRRATVWYIDRVDPDALHHEYSEVGERIIAPDIVADAQMLPIPDAGLNFVIASHVLEHMPFPLAALREWYRVLAPGGVLVLRIPDKRYTFDKHRPRTSLQHLINEDEHPADFDRRFHFAEWVEYVVACDRGSQEKESETTRLMEIDYSIHYHAWIDDDVRELLKYTRRSIHLNWSLAMFLPARFYRKECAAVMKKN
jgi:SAM-dependent methyltransferase